MVHRKENRAAYELRELLALSPDKAVGKVRRARTRFSSPALAEEKPQRKTVPGTKPKTFRRDQNLIRDRLVRSSR